MADVYRMDGHKMTWHLDRVNDWNNGKRIAPIHIDVGLSKGCNIRCCYCYGVTQGNCYRKGADIVFPREPLLQYMKDAGEVGVRSMALIGEAEPTLNPAMHDAIVAGKSSGIDMALGTNGILFTPSSDSKRSLEHLTWIRFNISAATDEAYQIIHSSNEFETTRQNITFCVDYKHKNNLPITVGLQMVLVPENVDQCIPLAKLGAELGVDYLEIKQCSDTQDNALKVYDRLHEYDRFNQILKEAEGMSREDYNVIIKWRMIKDKGIRNYDSCMAPPFLLYSSGDGRIYPCGMFFAFKEEEYRMGDLTKQSFKEIIESDRYWEVVDKVANIDVHTECYSSCRSHSINDFLWKIKHPPRHANFI